MVVQRKAGSGKAGESWREQKFCFFTTLAREKVWGHGEGCTSDRVPVAGEIVPINSNRYGS